MIYIKRKKVVPRTGSQLAPRCFSRYDPSILTKMRYCAPAWSGLCSANDRARLDAFLRLARNMATVLMMFRTTVTDLFAAVDQSLFK